MAVLDFNSGGRSSIVERITSLALAKAVQGVCSDVRGCFLRERLATRAFIDRTMKSRAEEVNHEGHEEHEGSDQEFQREKTKE